MHLEICMSCVENYNPNIISEMGALRISNSCYNER